MTHDPLSRRNDCHRQMSNASFVQYTPSPTMPTTSKQIKTQHTGPQQRQRCNINCIQAKCTLGTQAETIASELLLMVVVYCCTTQTSAASKGLSQHVTKYTTNVTVIAGKTGSQAEEEPFGTKRDHTNAHTSATRGQYHTTVT
jgi:hypothetical protein